MFFSYSWSLLNISCIFLIHASILFLRYWIIFTIITLNSFSDRLPIFSSFSCSCRFLPSSFVCNIFLCHLIFSNLLCCGLLSTGGRIVFPLASGVWVSLVQGLVQAFWWEGQVPASVGWSWVLSLWWAGPCQAVCFGVSVSLL